MKLLNEYDDVYKQLERNGYLAWHEYAPQTNCHFNALPTHHRLPAKSG